jgi:large subunit ribosomal protein L41
LLLPRLSSSGKEMALGILVGLLRGGRAVPKSGIGALTSKRGPRNFYKGKGCKSTGRHTSKGAYVLMEEKLPKYVVPDLTNCKLKPYVAHDTPTKLEVVSEKAAT